MLPGLSTLLSLLAACDPAVHESDPGEEVEFRCTNCCTSCGLGNSPAANGFNLDTLKLDGTLGPGNLRVVGIRAPDSTLYRLGVVEDEFVALTIPDGTLVASGASLVGWRISLQTSGYMTITLTIKSYNNAVPAWSNLGGYHTNYSFSFESNNGRPLSMNVCSGNIYTPNATLIAGETYDKSGITVNPGQPEFLTIACEGTAIYKMKMFGFGPNDLVDGVRSSTWQERQATLKMITADYCGDGTSYTTQGTQIGWFDALGTIDGTPDFASHEARWDENGALCLDTPRLADRADVACAASLPACTDPSPGWVWNTFSDHEE